MHVLTKNPLAIWLLLSLPLIAIKLGILLGIGFYTPAEFAEDSIVVLALCALLVLVSRWRVLAGAGWLIAWMAYVLALVLTLAEALSFYFQASSFNARFFANIQFDSLRSGLSAYPSLLISVALALLGMLCGSAILLASQSRQRAPDDSLHPVFKSIALALLLVLACTPPSTAHRLARFMRDYHQSDQLALTPAARVVAAHLVLDPPPKGEVYAKPGRNLVVIYMESLERIYTDNRIFPGLTPNLNRYRAQSLDFSGYQTFPGATFTMAGIFASQCGEPYFVSPWSAFDVNGNDNSTSSFHPRLACLGDVLHAAGYEQAYLNPATLSFAHQGEFFRLHGFDTISGLDELENENGNKLPKVGWGLYDRDLFQLAEKKFDRLAASHKPFNLDILTIDNHPPHGRPSPGCPHYRGNPNDVLQAVHCTDYLVGQFLDTISKNPAWKNTIVAVMSDHQSMRNDAWTLYPANYHRRPLLFILNAGSAERAQRVYHMDIAPTLLHLMGVKTNAQFIAGADRSATNASSPLTDDPVTLSVLRKVEWSHLQPLTLCRQGKLLQQHRGGQFEIAGRNVQLQWFGLRAESIPDDQVWTLVIAPSDIRATLISRDRLKAVLSAKGDVSILTVRSLLPMKAGKELFSVDWIGRNGALSHIANIPRLQGLKITSDHCQALLAEADRAADGAMLDLSNAFRTRTDPAFPQVTSVEERITLASGDAAKFKLGLGWFRDTVVGDESAVGFHLPDALCSPTSAAIWTIRPILHPWRPRMDVHVLVNGHQNTVWHFGEKDAAAWREVSIPLDLGRGNCDAAVRLVIDRPDSSEAHEDPRRLQLQVKDIVFAPSGRSQPAFEASAPATKLDVPLNAIESQVALSLQGEPVLLPKAGTMQLTVKVTNLGTATLVSHGQYPVSLGAHLLDAKGRNIRNEYGRASFPKPLQPGSSETVFIEVPMPPAGTKVAVLPVQEHVAWFNRWGVRPLVVGPIGDCSNQHARSACMRTDAATPRATSLRSDEQPSLR